jgi:hypothetical protein
MRLLVSLLAWYLRAVFTSRRSLALENFALRQQLAALTRTQKRPRLKPRERAFWMTLSKVWRDWRSPLVLVKPATVMAWHRRGHQRYWTWKCGQPGRPPIPNGAPNASPHIERFNRTRREEALNHFIFLDAKHVLRVCREYVEFYNRARPSQALHAIPEPYPELITPPRRSGELLALPVLGGVQHDYRLAA